MMTKKTTIKGALDFFPAVKERRLILGKVDDICVCVCKCALLLSCALEAFDATIDDKVV